MTNKCRIALVAILASLAATQAPGAWAQPCEAYYPFDGSLADASGNGFDGRMIGKDGAAATPRFVEGRSGQALAFDGTAAMRAFLDLNYENCSQVSFTAWVRFDGPVLPGNQEILATGGSGPGLRATGSNLTLNGTENGIGVRNAVHADSGWMFVAGVYDYAGNTYTLHWRNRNVEGTLSEHRRLPEVAIWVGAMDDNLTHPASNIVIDELRIIGRALDVEELRAVQAGGPSAATSAATSGSGDWRGVPCAQHAQCPADSYCGLDGQCHPGQHAPMPEAPRGSGITATTNPIQPGATISAPHDAPLSSTGSVPEEGSARPSVGVSQLPEEFGDPDLASGPRGAPDLTYESEEAAQAAAEQRRAQAEAEAAATDAAGDTGEAQAAVPRPTGAPRFSAIAGTSGDTQRMLDLENEFLHKIQWRDKDNAPCSIWVWGASAVNLRILDWCGSSIDPAAQSLFVGLTSTVISAIEVCQQDGNQVLKGIRVVGNTVNPDGTLVYMPAVYDKTLPGCESWSLRMLCPLDHVGTGIVVHSRERRVGDGRVIIGLQLVCRAVTVQGG